MVISSHLTKVVGKIICNGVETCIVIVLEIVKIKNNKTWTPWTSYTISYMSAFSPVFRGQGKKNKTECQLCKRLAKIMSRMHQEAGLKSVNKLRNKRNMIFICIQKSQKCLSAQLENKDMQNVLVHHRNVLVRNQKISKDMQNVWIYNSITASMMLVTIARVQYHLTCHFTPFQEQTLAGYFYLCSIPTLKTCPCTHFLSISLFFFYDLTDQFPLTHSHIHLHTCSCFN